MIVILIAVTASFFYRTSAATFPQRAHLPGATPVATPQRDRAAAQALAAWIAGPVGARARMTNIGTYSGGHAENPQIRNHGLETLFEGKLVGASRYDGFYGSINHGSLEPGVLIALTGPESALDDFAHLQPGDQERVRSLMGSLLTASGMGQDLDGRRIGEAKLSDFSAWADVPARSTEASPGSISIELVDGLIPRSGEVSIGSSGW